MGLGEMYLDKVEGTHVLIDLDGVVANFVDAAIQQHEKACCHDDITQWDMGDLWGISKNEFWGKIDDGGIEFWSSKVKAYPWLGELTDALRFRPWSVCTTPSKSHYSAGGKVLWMQKHFGSQFRDYVMTPQKHLLARPGAILIDDSDDNVSKFNDAGGRGMLFPQPWNENRHLVGERVQYVIEQLNA